MKIEILTDQKLSLLNGGYWIMKRYIILIISFVTFQVQAQTTFTGTVLEEERNPIGAAQVVIAQNDSVLRVVLTNTRGRFVLSELPEGNYTINLSAFGYSEINQPLFITDKGKATFVMAREMSRQIDEVVVTANRSDHITRTATGMIYQLSEKAKNSGDPFVALQEIPQLIVNSGLQSVKMEDQSTPLILINGESVNTGIAPIDPKDIESVEVIDVVSARYLRTGAKKILNIKLKKDRAPYQYLQVMERFDIPVQNMNALYFEVGNAKYSLYGRLAGNYIFDQTSEYRQIQESENYHKDAQQESDKDDKMGLGELQFKWMPTAKDYFVTHVYARLNDTRTEAEGNGSIKTNERSLFQMQELAKNRSDIYTATLFHKHAFASQNTLETTLAFNHNYNRNSNHRTEDYSNYLYNKAFLYKNQRTSGTLNIDYSYTWNDVNSLNIGSATDFKNDNIDQVSEGYPVFKHRQWNEYLYGTFSSTVKKLNYMLSLGYESIWLKAGETSHHYFKPRIALSANYSFSPNHSALFFYNLTNEAPSVGLLNPYNTSTDSLVISRGNPYLLPAQDHQLGLSYTFNKKGYFFSPAISYHHTKDLIEPYGYSEKGIYTSTYRNSGNYQQLHLRLSLNKRFKNLNISMNTERSFYYFEHQDAKKSWDINIDCNYTLSKWMFLLSGNFTNYSFSATTKTKHFNLSYSLLQVQYNFTSNFYIAAAVYNFAGSLRSRTTIETNGYRSVTYLREKDSFYPWILLRYTIRKNPNKRMKENKTVTSREQGIQLR